MPLKKLDDDKTWNRKVCRSPEHKPPGMMVYPPGRYEWTCPKCGETTVFNVALVTCGSGVRRVYDPRGIDILASCS